MGKTPLKREFKNGNIQGRIANEEDEALRFKVARSDF